MKQRSTILLLIGSTLIQTSLCQPPEKLLDKRFNEVTFLEAHNISRWKNPQEPYHSVDANQNLTVPELLELARKKETPLAIKTPVHFEKDYGKHQGQQPMASHGIYRCTFYNDYYGKLWKTIDSFNSEIEQDFSKLEKIPGLGHLAESINKKYDLFKNQVYAYKGGTKPIAQMERVARETTYGSNTQEAVVPFTPCVIDPSSRPLKEVLQDIRHFLDEHKQEIVTLTIENATGNTDAIAQECIDANIVDYAHGQNKTEPWPTLRELIEADKRLIPIITTSIPEGKYPWLNHEGDFAWSSKYNFHTKKELLEDTHLPTENENFKRRHQEPKNTLFYLANHLTFIFAGRPDLAEEVNTHEVLKHRVKNIAEQAQSQPNFLAVDFVELPNEQAFDFVNELNNSE